MVEPAPDFNTRASSSTTPRPSSKLKMQNAANQNEGKKERSRSTFTSPFDHARVSPLIFSLPLPGFSQSNQGPHTDHPIFYEPYEGLAASVNSPASSYTPLPSDDSRTMPDSHSLPHRGRRGSSPRGRPPSHPPPNTRRSSNLQPVQPPPYAVPPLHSPPDAAHPGIASPASPYPPGYPTALVSYPPQRHGYVGPYTIAPPTAMRLGPTPSFAYGFPHSENMLPQPIHSGYPSMMPPTPGQLYQVNASRAPHSPMSPQGTSTPPSFAGNGQFHSLQYPHHATPPYTYPSQSFPSTPTHYQSPYPPSYPQHFPVSSPEHEHGMWWYVPSHPQSPQYEGPPQYSRPYPVAYTLSTPDAEPPYGQANTSVSSSSTPGIAYQPPPPWPIPSSSNPPLLTPTRTESSDPPPPSIPPSSPSSRKSPLPPPRSERAVVRRPYHPNPPAHRSEWVMWVGNVPSDATHDEAWRFFTSPLGEGSPNHPPNNGVISIFLISRSCCVFVNFDSKEHLKAGIERFNGMPLRPHDARCPRLVCRERGKGDDLKAGVGGQRGSGMHMRWIREQKAKGREGQSAELTSPDDPPTSPSVSEYLGRASISSDDDGRASRGTKPQSTASTTSSVLSRYFPQRYFILKSLSQYDLDLSVEKGLWATQKHNEDILDQAYRTSKEVFLIFGVNKSGEFYGYARMAGPLRNGEHDIRWESRTHSSTSSHSVSGLQQDVITEETGTPSQSLDQPFFSPAEGRQVDKSPAALSPEVQMSQSVKVTSAPAVVGQRPQFSLSPLSSKHSLDPTPLAKVQAALAARRGVQGADFHLDAGAPLRAIRAGTGTEDTTSSPKLDSVMEVEENVVAVADGQVEGARKRDPSWGDPFKVEWICTQRLPFQRTRQLRNPWNHGKEIKVSRDGTELEPGLGRQLLEEWAQYAREVASGEIISDSGHSKPRPMGPSKTVPALPTSQSQGPSGTSTEAKARG